MTGRELSSRLPCPALFGAAGREILLIPARVRCGECLRGAAGPLQQGLWGTGVPHKPNPPWTTARVDPPQAGKGSLT